MGLASSVACASGFLGGANDNRHAVESSGNFPLGISRSNSTMASNPCSKEEQTADYFQYEATDDA